MEVIQKTEREEISVGHTVVVEWDGAEKTFTIVGPNEVDPSTGRISNESPVGISLLGKRAGGKATIRTPSGQKEVHILRVE